MHKTFVLSSAKLPPWEHENANVMLKNFQFAKTIVSHFNDMQQHLRIVKVQIWFVKNKISKQEESCRKWWWWCCFKVNFNILTITHTEAIKKVLFICIIDCEVVKFLLFVCITNMRSLFGERKIRRKGQRKYVCISITHKYLHTCDHNLTKWFLTPRFQEGINT